MEQQRRCQRRVEGAIAHASRLERIEATGRYCEYTPPAPVNEEAIRAEAAAARALAQELAEPLGSA